jgi:uncharacterized membrane protein YeaQ/YmgE (transglycosylase-associated protein family)
VLGTVIGTQSKINRIEEIAIGAFGAAMGGDMLATYILGPDVGQGFRMGALMLALTGASVVLGLLVVMRRAVGPQRSHKKRTGNKF